MNRVAISSPYAPYIPTAAAPAAGNAAAIKGAPNAGRTKPCLSITFVSFRDNLSIAKSSLTKKQNEKVKNSPKLVQKIHCYRRRSLRQVIKLPLG